MLFASSAKPRLSAAKRAVAAEMAHWKDHSCTLTCMASTKVMNCRLPLRSREGSFKAFKQSYRKGHM
jgi:hypothetical protein